MSRYRRSYGPSMFDRIMFLIPIIGGITIAALFLAGVLHIP